MIIIPKCSRSIVGQAKKNTQTRTIIFCMKWFFCLFLLTCFSFANVFTYVYKQQLKLDRTIEAHEHVFEFVGDKKKLISENATQWICVYAPLMHAIGMIYVYP